MSLFLSTLSLRRATLGGLWVLSTQIFLSTLSLRRATKNPMIRVDKVPNISIHALLAESDRYDFATWMRTAKISIHALLAESDCFSVLDGL